MPEPEPKDPPPELQVPTADAEHEEATQLKHRKWYFFTPCLPHAWHKQYN